MTTSATASAAPGTNPTIARLIGIVLGVILGLSGVTWIQFVTRQLEASPVSSPVNLLPFLIVFPAFLVAVAAHEIGHWLACRYVGFRCIGFAVAWLHLERKAGRWRLRLGPRTYQYWGFVQGLPLDFAAYRTRQALFLAGGPAASLLTGALALLAHHAWQPALLPTAGASVPAFALDQGVLLLGWISLLLGVLNLLPNTPRTDGAKLLSLWRGGAAQARQEGLQRLISASYQGTRPRDWHPTLLGQILPPPEAAAPDCTAHLCAYAHQLDSQRFDAAWAHLHQALELRHLTTPALQQHLFCEAAYFAAVLTDEPDYARQWFAAAEEVRRFKPREAVFTRAALAYAQRDYASARQLLARCRPEVELTDDLGGRAQGLDRLDQLQWFVEAQAHPAPANAAGPAASLATTTEAPAHPPLPEPAI